jgi:hypothetical protein
VYSLELASIAKKAVTDFRGTVWRIMAGTSGMVAFVALGIAIWHK